MVFAGLFPTSDSDFNELSEAMEKLTLNDSSVSISKEHSLALGPGFRCGFLGLLHMDVFITRLEQEFQQTVITTAPTVPYSALMDDGTTIDIESPAAFPTDLNKGLFYCSTNVSFFFHPLSRFLIIISHLTFLLFFSLFYLSQLTHSLNLWSRSPLSPLMNTLVL